ncbi:MAG: glucose-6-phosphate dehydrogenase [Acetobacteraceae bacterium]|nr:glucose-6-phosphate dehydrogenase [Acetobacteraceae bacterium]
MSEPPSAPPRRGGPPEPCALVLFGAGGDLTRRLIVPSLHNLARAGLLPEGFALVGVARAEMDDDGFRHAMREAAQASAAVPDEAAWERLARGMRYLRGDITDPGLYAQLGRQLEEVERDGATGGNRLFYLAVADHLFATVVGRLGAAGLVREAAGGAPWRRVVIEKPFGHDLPSARALDREVLSVLSERQIFRMDHFLGKETVQNIMVLRFANGLFEPIWNRDHIDHVQITVAEAVGVEHRAAFYERTGALRDMVPNHVFQLLALTAMEPPNSFDADAVRTEKAKALDAIRPLTPEDVARNVVRGQYGAGALQGAAVTAYRGEPGVAGRSGTETFVAMRLMLDNWRWAGVPFYLRTGKRLAARRSEIAARFRQAPFALFRGTPAERLTSNFLVLHIQPDEGISLQFNAKVPGPQLHIDGVRMDFRYCDWFDAAPSTGYETLLHDVMAGDGTLFQRADTIEAGWRVVQPILDAWRDGGGAPAPYEAGGQGPEAAEELLARDGRRWRPVR